MISRYALCCTLCLWAGSPGMCLSDGALPQALPLQRGSGGLGSFSDDGRDEDGATGLDDDLLTGSIGERDPMLTYHGAPFYLFSGYQSQSVQSRGGQQCLPGSSVCPAAADCLFAICWH